jgi:hypothetical protein
MRLMSELGMVWSIRNNFGNIGHYLKRVIQCEVPLCIICTNGKYPSALKYTNSYILLKINKIGYTIPCSICKLFLLDTIS